MKRSLVIKELLESYYSLNRGHINSEIVRKSKKMIKYFESEELKDEEQRNKNI